MTTERRFYGGSHHCEGKLGTYDLRIDDEGVISCGECGARDLLPEREAVKEAGGLPGEINKL